MKAYLEDRHFTLTCEVGRFFFTRDVILSHAKIVRDTIMNAVLQTSDGRKIRQQSDRAHIWFREHTDGPAKETYFEWEPA